MVIVDIPTEKSSGSSFLDKEVPVPSSTTKQYSASAVKPTAPIAPRLKPENAYPPTPQPAPVSGQKLAAPPAPARAQYTAASGPKPVAPVVPQQTEPTGQATRRVTRRSSSGSSLGFAVSAVSKGSSSSSGTGTFSPGLSKIVEKIRCLCRYQTLVMCMFVPQIQSQMQHHHTSFVEVSLNSNRFELF